ncbi:MAG: L-histidine N(alpha)-methyltransferase [Rhodospirillaceae bacterium]|nr:L-histidine N(alpha)-methyltransferase [Rhodospirillaceae bacterium]
MEHTDIKQDLTGDSGDGGFLDEVLAGLSKSPKTLPCKYLYDEKGSQLFDAICELDEYYPTSTEEMVLRDNSGEIADLIGPEAQLIEYGAGSLQKVRILLDSMEAPAAVIPLDISREHLMASAKTLAEEYPQVEILPVCADFSTPTSLPEPVGNPEAKKVGFFPGSTIGNFTPEEVINFLEIVADDLGAQGEFLLGVDVKKDESILRAAYNDREGVTAAFNINLLHRINRELKGNFDLSKWRHDAIYNDDRGRVEMHLVSQCAQTAHIMGQPFEFTKDETIHTESSHKYNIEEFVDLAKSAGFSSLQTWMDKKSMFSVHYLKVA